MSGQLKRRIIDDLNHDDIVGGEGGAVGDWRNFVPEPGWTTSTLRYRLVPAGLQFDGNQLGNPGADIGLVRLGVLPPGYNPGRQTALMCFVVGGPVYTYGYLVFQANGDVYAWYAGAGNQFIVSGIVPMD